MSNTFIKMQDVNLFYPSYVYNAKTLKAEIFSRIKLQKPKENLEDIHALRNINLYIEEGERVGVIGRNGAGKSTLLKALAGIYPIKTGAIDIQGEIRSLFELTLGFDMNSTGRENILYRGLMLGGTPKEVKERQEEIIQFAELEQFIDYPISSYSSGMLVRLAFAISTSISGDILLIDEVFGAGDFNFQQKARKRMAELMEQAKILVLVLHDIGTIREMCNRVILLEKGKIVADGDPDEVTKYYLERQ